MSSEICQCVRSEGGLPLFVLSLPEQECDFDELLPKVLHVLDSNARPTGIRGALEYEILIFCAGRVRPSWPWLIQNFSHLDKRYKKGLQKLYLVHEKSWIRVCMQLLENLVSPKFARKVRHVKTLGHLDTLLGERMSRVVVPAGVRVYDAELAQEEESGQRRRRPLAVSESRGNRATLVHEGELQGIGKRKPSPPAVPPSRASRPQSPVKNASASQRHVPSVPARRSTSSRAKSTRNISSESLIIFEDPEEEEGDEAAADKAASTLAEILARTQAMMQAPPSTTTTATGQRSSSAPTPDVRQPSRVTSSLKSGGAAAASQPHAPATLRRAISGPVTPSGPTRQPFLPSLEDRDRSPPKLLIRGRRVGVRTRAFDHHHGGLPNETPGKVGGLRALFEQKALVAQSLS